MKRFFSPSPVSRPNAMRRHRRTGTPRPARSVRVDVQPLEPRLALAAPDTIAPAITSIAGPKAQTYGEDAVLAFTVTLTEKIVVTGSPTLRVTIGGDSRQAVWDSKAGGPNSLVFKTSVRPGDLAPTGVSVIRAIALNGGATIRDASGNALRPRDTLVTFPAVTPVTTLNFPRVRVEAVGPRVTEFRPVSVTPALLTMRVTFTEPVTVTGLPSIPFTLGGAARQLVYAKGTGTSELTFSYKPAAGEAPTDANVAVKNPAIVLGTARITDRFANAATSLSCLNVSFVEVGAPGNRADDTGYGAVGYAYRIATYETTIAQYTRFLNAVAATDTNDLYDPRMATDTNAAGIARSGAPGTYTYSVIAGSGNKPVTYVGWWDAARFANWMHNGQPSGSQNALTTEDGAYTLRRETAGPSPARNAGARFHIPTENEWYKAAYYKGGGSRAGYWNYPTRSDSAPDNLVDGGANQANYFNTKYAVTQSAAYAAGQNYLTNVGAFSDSASASGTFDQGGNVAEWNDLDGRARRDRGLLGGAWANGFSVGARGMASSSRSTYSVVEYFYDGTRWNPFPDTRFGDSSVGFRIASRT